VQLAHRGVQRGVRGVRDVAQRVLHTGAVWEHQRRTCTPSTQWPRCSCAIYALVEDYFNARGSRSLICFVRVEHYVTGKGALQCSSTAFITLGVVRLVRLIAAGPACA